MSCIVCYRDSLCLAGDDYRDFVLRVHILLQMRSSNCEIDYSGQKHFLWLTIDTKHDPGLRDTNQPCLQSSWGSVLWFATGASCIGTLYSPNGWLMSSHSPQPCLVETWNFPGPGWGSAFGKDGDLYPEHLYTLYTFYFRIASSPKTSPWMRQTPHPADPSSISLSLFL